MSPICHQRGQIFAPVRPAWGPWCTRLAPDVPNTREGAATLYGALRVSAWPALCTMPTGASRARAWRCPGGARFGHGAGRARRRLLDDSRAGDGLPRRGGTWRWRRDGRPPPAKGDRSLRGRRVMLGRARQGRWAHPRRGHGVSWVPCAGIPAQRHFTTPPLPEKISRKIFKAKNRPPAYLRRDPPGNFSG